MILQWSQARPAIARAIGYAPGDPAVLDYANLAIQRLVQMPRDWVGTVQRYRFCAYSGCISLPRQLQCIKQAWLCNWPVPVRNSWFESLNNGPGLMSDKNSCATAFVDHGDAPAFNNVTGLGQYLAVKADVPEAAGLVVTVLSYDNNPLFVRTQVAGSWIDGEQIPISTTLQVSVNQCREGGLVGIVKPPTNGLIRIFQYTPAGAILKPLAIMEPDETNAQYRRYLIPGLTNMGGCCQTPPPTTPCAQTTVTVSAKKRYIPIVNDSDFLIIGNLPALVFMVQSIQKFEKSIADEGQLYESKALEILDHEFGNDIGDAVGAPQIQSSDLFGAGGIANVLCG